LHLKTQIQNLVQSMQDIVATAKADGDRDLTAEEAATISAKAAEADKLRAQLDAAEKASAAMARIGDGSGGDGDGSFLALTGPAAKAAAANIGSSMRELGEQRGEKSLVTSGSLVTGVPLVEKSPLELQRVPTSILNVLRVREAINPQYKILRQTQFTNNAAIVAPGETKPTTTMQIETVEQKLQVFAHLSEPVDKYLLLDNETLISFIQSQLLWGLGLALEKEILKGSGTTNHLTGILSTTGVQQQAYAGDALSTLRAAVTSLETVGHEANVFIVHSEDWEALETARNASGNFDLGAPIDRAERRIWGVQVITTPNIEKGTALALDLDALFVAAGAESVHIQWDGGGDLFEKNQVRARVEGRFGLAITRPAGIVSIDLTAGA
jgi:HK97 family phage major capsid protein